MMDSDFLISGATGATGGAATEELLSMGARVRAYVRSDGDAAAGLRQRGVDVAIGGFMGVDDIRAAMEGVRTAYFCTRSHPA